MNSTAPFLAWGGVIFNEKAAWLFRCASAGRDEFHLVPDFYPKFQIGGRGGTRPHLNSCRQTKGVGDAQPLFPLTPPEHCGIVSALSQQNYMTA
ncbi:MAG TPA: hypothetical protein VNT26_19525 [Candidatus Sulfotelmatobacter sp.]|nr:hypothetical protein [Candidatus Sulfotelmatobacter sp.]HWI57325.1 hypothetical protein [Bacillota bacterium]